MASKDFSAEIWGLLGSLENEDRFASYAKHWAYPDDSAPAPSHDDTASTGGNTDDTASTSYTHVPSVFSRRTGQASSEHSMQTPRRGPEQLNFTQTLQAQGIDDYGVLQQEQVAGLTQMQAHDHPLWCELRDLRGCPAEFSIAETDLWIEHHRVAHLGDRYPSHLACWFCDHVPFVAAHRRDRYSNFVNRMEHIRQHIWDEYKVPDDMRPDFRMITHLRELGLISKAVYDTAMGYSELPAALRLPGGSSSHSVPAEPRASDGSHVHDLRRERRPPRARGHRSHHGSSQHRHGH